MSLVSVDIVNLSRKTDSPIEYVPLIVLYLNGVPICRYEDEPSEQGIINFIVNILLLTNN